jgi:hypothetical protein
MKKVDEIKIFSKCDTFITELIEIALRNLDYHHIVAFVAKYKPTNTTLSE